MIMADMDTCSNCADVGMSALSPLLAPVSLLEPLKKFHSSHPGVAEGFSLQLNWIQSLTCTALGSGDNVGKYPIKVNDNHPLPSNIQIH